VNVLARFAVAARAETFRGLVIGFSS
jgi:hypothetical protein